MANEFETTDDVLRLVGTDVSSSSNPEDAEANRLIREALKVSAEKILTQRTAQQTASKELAAYRASEQARIGASNYLTRENPHKLKQPTGEFSIADIASDKEKLSHYFGAKSDTKLTSQLANSDALGYAFLKNKARSHNLI